METVVTNNVFWTKKYKHNNNKTKNHKHVIYFIYIYIIYYIYISKTLLLPEAVTGQKTLFLINRKDARRYRLQSPPMQSSPIQSETHPTISTKNDQNPFKIPDNVTTPL